MTNQINIHPAIESGHLFLGVEPEERAGGYCPNCGEAAELRICATCGGASHVIDCGHYPQPRPICASEDGSSYICSDCYAELVVARALPEDNLDELHGKLLSGGRELDDSLPLYGGEAPSDTEGVWSWDKNRVLVGTCVEDLKIENRDYLTE